MNYTFDYIRNLQYKVKILEAKVTALESADALVRMQSKCKKQLSQQRKEIKEFKRELAEARAQLITNRQNWQQVIEDMEKEHAKQLQKKDTQIKASQRQILELQRQLDEQRDKLREKYTECYQVATELEEEKGKNQKLRAQINRDHENSSISSSERPNYKKIVNNREETDRKPGGQPGHKGHARKKLSPTSIIEIPAPSCYADNPDYRLTGKIITKQLVNLQVCVTVEEYRTPEWRHIQTGSRVHADFPPGLVLDVNYGGSVKAIALLLNHHCCVSIDKTKDFLADLTNGQLQISKGMISNLTKAFSARTQTQQKKVFADLQLSPVLHTDFTNARLNGKRVQVIVCADPDNVLYSARERKGHMGVKNTVVEDYQGILVHDHDRTFYRYGHQHQECLAHILRYLKDSIENEPNLTWNQHMRDLIREMIHWRNCLPPDSDWDSDQVSRFQYRYLDILQTAKREYEYEPPSRYYKEGYNLYRRMDRFQDAHLLFLQNPRVPTNNNLAERLLRIFKRKQKQAMTFRSFESLGYLCNSLSMVALLRSQNRNLFSSISDIFS